MPTAYSEQNITSLIYWRTEKFLFFIHPVLWSGNSVSEDQSICH